MDGSLMKADSSQDPWSIWFARLVQVVGLLIAIEQVVVGQVQRHDRLLILALAMAMMLGGVGLQLLLRVVLRIGGGE